MRALLLRFATFATPQQPSHPHLPTLPRHKDALRPSYSLLLLAPPALQLHLARYRLHTGRHWDALTRSATLSAA